MYLQIEIQLIAIIVMGIAVLRNLVNRKSGQNVSISQLDSNNQDFQFNSNIDNQQDGTFSNNDRKASRKRKDQFEILDSAQKMFNSNQQQIMKRLQQKLKQKISFHFEDQQKMIDQSQFLWKSKNIYLESIVHKKHPINDITYRRYFDFEQSPSFPSIQTNYDFIIKDKSILHRKVSFNQLMDVEQQNDLNSLQTKLFRSQHTDFNPKSVQKTKKIIKNKKNKNKHQKWRKQWIKKIVQRFIKQISLKDHNKMKWNSHQQLWAFINSEWQSYRQKKMFNYLPDFFRGLSFKNKKQFDKWFLENDFEKPFTDFFDQQFTQFFSHNNGCKMLIHQQAFIDEFKNTLYRQYSSNKLLLKK